MQDGSDGKDPAGRSVALLKTSTVAFLVLGLVSSLYHTYIQQILFLEHDTGAFGRFAPIGQFVSVAFWLIGLLQLYAVQLLARPPFEPAVKGLAVLATTCLSVNLLFNLVGMVAPDSTTHWFASTKWMLLLSLTDLAGVLLLLAAVLKVSRRAVDTLAVACVVVVLTREAVGWGTSLLTNDRTVTTIWVGFAVRMVFMLAELGLRYAILNRASADLASGVVPVETDEGLGQTDASELRARGVLFGGMWLAGGIFVTALSYSAAASSPTGGRYMVAYGAVIYGVVRIVRAMMLR